MTSTAEVVNLAGALWYTMLSLLTVLFGVSLVNKVRPRGRRRFYHTAKTFKEAVPLAPGPKTSLTLIALVETGIVLLLLVAPRYGLWSVLLFMLSLVPVALMVDDEEDCGCTGIGSLDRLPGRKSRAIRNAAIGTLALAGLLLEPSASLEGETIAFGLLIAIVVVTIGFAIDVTSRSSRVIREHPFRGTTVDLDATALPIEEYP